jgi:hypothetical protein
MKMYKSLLQVGNEQKLVVAINYTGEEKAKETTVDRLHHIHVLDRSGSMSGHINGLVDNVKQTHEAMADGDLISVVWFSGEGQGAILIKGATKTDDVNKLLDTIRSTVGLTCFSEALQKVNTIIDDLSVLCSNFNVTFFTDGHTVTYHSEKEEEDRIFSQIEKMKNRIMALNTIGYGNYYNQDLLGRMADATMYGKMIHSSKINDYKEIWTHNYQILSDMVMEKVTIDTEAGEFPPSILYLSNKTTKLTSEGFMELNFLDKKKNQFFLILNPVDTMFYINDEQYNANEIKAKIPAPTIKNFYYALAAEKYYIGHTDDALDILAHQLHDKHAIDTHLAAFTADERAEFQKELNGFVFKNRTRLKDGEAPLDYVPADDAFCVMDLLKLLATGSNFYVPVKDYNRIGLKVDDQFNLFTANKEEVKAPFNDFVFNSQHLNLSVRYMVNGTVKLNPKQAKANNLPTVIDSRIFRNQTIIKDGNLNVTKFQAWIDKATSLKLFKLLQDKTLPMGVAVPVLGSVKDDSGSLLHEIDLTKLPIINRMYAKKSSDIKNVLTIAQQIEKLKASQKVLNHYIGKIPLTFIQESNPIGLSERRVDTKSLSSEQLEVLKEHGLNAKLDYQGVDNQSSEKNENDYYISRLIQFTIKGWSSLPKVDDVVAKSLKGAKLNEPATAMLETINEIADRGIENNKDELEASLATVKSELFDLNVELNTLKMAKVLTGSWWEGLEVDAKNNYTYENLIIKSDRVKKFF